MIEIKATVIEQAPGRVWVKTQQGCSACHSGCGLGEVGRFLTRHPTGIPLACPEAPTPGEEVTLALSEPALLWAGLLVYLLPALFMVMGTALATLLDGSDMTAIAAALGGLLLGLLLMRLANHPRFSPPTPQLVRAAPYSTVGDSEHERSHV